MRVTPLRRRSESEVSFEPGAEGGGHALELGFGTARYAGEEVVGAFNEEDVARL